MTSVCFGPIAPSGRDFRLPDRAPSKGHIRSIVGGYEIARRFATTQASGQSRASSTAGRKRMKHFFIFGGLLMAAILIRPVTAMADDHHGEKRYYDRKGRDYHHWNDDEDRRYHAYL